MYVEADNPSKEILKGLLQRYNQGHFLNVVEDVSSILQTYDQSVFLWNLLGATYLGLNKFEDAANAFVKTVELKPDYAEGYGNCGLALHKQHKYKEAADYYNRALELNPELAETHNNVGHLYRKQNKPLEAIQYYENALKYAPDLTEAKVFKFQQQAHICDWRFYDDYEEMTKQFGINGEAIEPFSLISKEDNPERQLLCAQNCARLKYKRAKLADFIKPESRPEKLRIGYFSSDFHNHPVMHLMAGLLEKHDRNKFEIIAFYFGSKDTDEELARVKGGVDEFIDIRQLDEQHTVDLARSKNLDIAIDVTGYTGSSRTGVFAYRVAPIQINYLGYPSTMGADFIEYIVADKTLIPEEYRNYYSENIIYMPFCYQPNDNLRAISDKEMTRADFGLPDDAFVLCCFNNNFKIGPSEFDIWMRLLTKIDGSVLWMFRANADAENNLKKEAQKRGVDPERLVFADRLPLDEHLARHRLADLFVDTFNYNAHTTASDALWTGLPVVTKIGKQFAARVAASLLNAVDLPELVTRSNEEYEALILELAQNAGKLNGYKRKLADTCMQVPLFDTERYTRHMENAYELAYQKYLSGETPSVIEVSE